MKIEIEFDDRQYRDIESYCNANNLTFQEYIIGIISEKHSINKFGDLNELITKAVDESTVEVKKRGRQKKTVEETVSLAEEAPKEIIKEEIKVPLGTQGENLSKPTIKRKRTLKTL